MATQHETTYQQPIERVQHTLDATEQSLGRLASHVAALLIGKHKPTYAPHRDMGDRVHVTHAAKIKLTGKKLDQKLYYHHTGYPGGLRTKKMGDVFENDPAEVIKRSVGRMLPQKKFKKDMLKRLTITA